MKSGTFKSDISGTFVSDTSGTFGVIYSPKGFEFDLYDLGMALASEKGLDVKSCTLCNYFKRSNSLARRFRWASQCVQIKNLQLPKNDKFKFAYRCRCYRYDDNWRKNIIDSFQSIPYDVWVKNG